MCPVLWGSRMVGGMGMSAVGVMSASKDTTMAMVIVMVMVMSVVMDGVVKTIVAMVGPHGTPV